MTSKTSATSCRSGLPRPVPSPHATSVFDGDRVVRRPQRAVRQPALLAASRRTGGEALLDAVLPEISSQLGDDRFLTWMGVKGRRAETRAVHYIEALMWAYWLSQNAAGTTVATATVEHVRAYRDHLLDAGLSTSTARLSLAGLRVYYDFHGEAGGAVNPARQLPLPPRAGTVITPYTRDQADRILSAAADAAACALRLGEVRGWLLASRDHAMLAVLYYAGVRRGELRRLRVTDVDVALRQLHIKGKGGRGRTVSIPTVLVALLAGYLAKIRRPADDGAFLFAELIDGQLDAESVAWRNAGPDDDLGRLHSPKMQAQIAGEDSDYGLAAHTASSRAHLWGRRARIDGAHGSHRWRHTHASLCAESGMTLEQIAARLGHDLRRRAEGLGWTPTTLRYIHVSDTYLAELVQHALPHPLAARTGRDDARAA